MVTRACEKLTFLVDISDDGGGKGTSGNGHESFSHGSAPNAVVYRTGGSDAGEQKHQIILAGQLLGRGDVTAETSQNLRNWKDGR